MRNACNDGKFREVRIFLLSGILFKFKNKNAPWFCKTADIG